MVLHLLKLPDDFLFLDLTEHIFLVLLLSLSTVKLISLNFIVISVFFIKGLLVCRIGFLLANLEHAVSEVLFFHHVVGLDAS